VSAFNRRGFTLLEVLIALVIISGAIIVVANSWSGNFARIRKSSLNHDVATLLERKMVEIDAFYKDRAINEIPEDDAGDFGSDYPNYRWELKSKDFKMPDLTPLMVGQEDGGEEALIAMIKQMSEFLNEVIKEVQITVYVKARGRELAYSATQYYIDYTRDFAMGGGGGAADSSKKTDKGDGVKSKGPK